MAGRIEGLAVQPLIDIALRNLNPLNGFRSPFIELSLLAAPQLSPRALPLDPSGTACVG
jgi:hypothetical protein